MHSHIMNTCKFIKHQHKYCNKPRKIHNIAPCIYVKRCTITPKGKKRFGIWKKNVNAIHVMAKIKYEKLHHSISGTRGKQNMHQKKNN